METPMPQAQPGKTEAPAVEPTVIRATDRKRVTVPGNPAGYELMTPEGTPQLRMFTTTLAPGQSTGEKELKHSGDEATVVLTGTLEFWVENLTYKLGPGDTIFIPRGQRHRVSNAGKETGSAIFVLSPPEY